MHDANVVKLHDSSNRMAIKSGKVHHYFTKTPAKPAIPYIIYIPD